ncbi:hypothetical protein ACSV5M_00270 [Cellvibrio sp. ARAG 10.3]|uniref:hypothetical protein n=1 Tax=Cellvibrio sp. ARAG 10.3 TaxID=3451358 RepID=UPI003F481093
MRKVIVLLIIFLSGCGTTPMTYQAEPMSINEAYEIIDQMIMSQHRDWAPDYFVITDKYLGWDYGSISYGTTNAIVYNNFALGNSSTTIRNAGERVYFSKVGGVKLYSWKRKFKQWYTVALIDKNEDLIKHILRTRDLSDAQQLFDAMTVLLNDRSDNEQSSP